MKSPIRSRLEWKHTEHVGSKSSSLRRISLGNVPHLSCNDEGSFRRRRPDRKTARVRAIGDMTTPSKWPYKYRLCNEVCGRIATNHRWAKWNHISLSSISGWSAYSTAPGEMRLCAVRTFHAVAFESDSFALELSPKYSRQRKERWKEWRSRSSRHFHWDGVYEANWPEYNELEMHRRTERRPDSSRSTSNPISHRKCPKWSGCIPRLSCRHWCTTVEQWGWKALAKWLCRMLRTVSRLLKRSVGRATAMTGELQLTSSSRHPVRKSSHVGLTKRPWRNRRWANDSCGMFVQFEWHRNGWWRQEYHWRSQLRTEQSRIHRPDSSNGRDRCNGRRSPRPMSRTNWPMHCNYKRIVDFSRLARANLWLSVRAESPRRSVVRRRNPDKPKRRTKSASKFLGSFWETRRRSWAGRDRPNCIEVKERNRTERNAKRSSDQSLLASRRIPSPHDDPWWREYRSISESKVIRMKARQVKNGSSCKRRSFHPDSHGQILGTCDSLGVQENHFFRLQCVDQSIALWSTVVAWSRSWETERVSLPHYCHLCRFNWFSLADRQLFCSVLFCFSLTSSVCALLCCSILLFLRMNSEKSDIFFGFRRQFTFSPFSRRKDHVQNQLSQRSFEKRMIKWLVPVIVDENSNTDRFLI